MVPFYIFYSMFGFQRVGDLIWQAADARARASCSAPPPGARRCSARACSTRTATASCSPRPCRRARPTTRPSPTRWPTIVKHGIRRMYGPSTAGARPRRLLLPHPLQRELPDAADAARATARHRGRDRAGPVPRGRRRPRAVKRATILFSGSAQGAARQAAAELAEHYDVRRRAVVGHVVQGAARRGARRSSAGTACTPASRPARPLVTPRCSPTRRARSSPSPTS